MAESRAWTRLAATAAIATYLLIVLGGIVRITGSGMGCGDDWPLCNGRILPPLDDPATLIEFGHRLAASAVSILVIGLAAIAWWKGRGSGWADQRRVAAAAVGLLVLQILLGAITVWMELPPASVVLHLGTGMLLLAMLILATCMSAAGDSHGRRRTDRGATVSVVAAGAAFVVVLLGALVANYHATAACLGFPLCNGRVLPASAWPVQLHWTHRMAAYALFIGLLFLPGLTSRWRSGDRPSVRPAWLALGIGVAQVAVAADMVMRGFPDMSRAIHVALGAALFATLVVYAWRMRRPLEEG